jgi:hypothetical protein
MIACGKLRYFGISAPGIPKGEFPCTRKSRNPKSRWRKPRNSGACLEFGVSEFRLPGNPGARPLVVAYPEIPMEEIPK